MSVPDTTDANEMVEDPIYRHCLREARFIFCVWSICFVYTVTYCYFNGYLSHEPLPTSTGPGVGTLLGPLTQFDRDPASLEYPLGLGIPDWVFYGIVLPWLAAGIVSIWFCFFFFVEDDLSDTSESESQVKVAE